MFRKQRSQRCLDGLLAFAFLNSFGGVFSSSKILNDFTKSDINLDFSAFFCMELPEPLQPKLEVLNLKFTASFWILLLAS